MLFHLWHLKLTLYVVFLATGLGKEAFRGCSQDNCYVISEEVTLVNRDPNQRDANEIRINRVGDTRFEREVNQNYRGSLKRTAHRTRSDVTRHLEGRNDERIGIPKQFDYPERLIISDVNREQSKTIRDSNERVGDITRQSLNDREALRPWNNKENDKDSNYSHEEYEHLDESNLSKDSKRNEKGYSEQLDELDTRRHHRKIEVNFVRNLKNNREEISRRLDDKQIQRDISRTLERNYEKGLKVQSSRRSDNIEKRQDTVRRLGAHLFERDISRHTKIERHDESKRNRVERYEFSRSFDRDVLYDVVRRLEDNTEERHVVLRRNDNRDFNRRLGDILESRHIDQQLLQRQPKSLEHRDENTRDRIRFVQTLESPRIVERFSINDRELNHRREENEQLRLERREIQSAHSGVIREFERPLQSVNERAGTKLVRIEEFEDSQIRSGYNGNLKEEYEEFSNTVSRREYREVEHDVRRCSENRENDRNALVRFDNHENHGRQSSNNENLRLLDNESVQERLGRRYERETQYDVNRLLGRQRFYEGNRIRRSDSLVKERSQMVKKLDARDFRQELYDIRDTERIKRQDFQKNSEFVQHLGENELERKRTLSRHVDRNTSTFDRWLHDVERDTKLAFLHKESVNQPINYRLLEENYTEKSTVFLRRIYMVLGQTAILAYVVMKTLKGKNNLLNQLPIKLGGIEEIIGF